jgi:predicted N-acetyltransferase YhbS
MSDDEFEWWFERNPAGPALIRVAEDGARIVAVAAMSPYRVLVHGEERVAFVPLHVATHPDYRGRGVFARLEAENEARAAELSPIAITFPNAASRRVFRGRLGWRDLPSPRVWATLGARRARDPVAEVQRFGAEADELWRRVARSHGLVRDRTYLNWRFADAPRGYRLFAGEGGLAVVGRRRVRGRELAFLADLVAESAGAAQALVRHCLRAARGVPFLALDPPAGLGFVPTPKRIAVMARELRAGARVPESGWRFSLGDGDSF